MTDAPIFHQIESLTLADEVARLERTLLDEAATLYPFSRKRQARTLGVSLRTLYYMLDRHDRTRQRRRVA